MSRKKEYISQLSKSDKLLCNALRCCHFVRPLQYVSANRVKSFEKQGIIQKVVVTNPKDKDIYKDVYKLTEKGKAFIISHSICNSKSFYSSADAYRHDIKLFEVFSKLSIEHQMNWRTESQLRQELQDRLEELRTHDISRFAEIQDRLISKSISPCDGAYTNEQGETICVEIVGNYTQEQIESKIEFCQVMEYQCDLRR